MGSRSIGQREAEEEANNDRQANNDQGEMKDEKKEKVPTHNMKVKSVVDGSMAGSRWKGPPDVNM